jgi:hypothetical protein
MTAVVRPKLVPHQVLVGATQIGVLVPDVYEGNGSNIADVVGVQKVAAGSSPDASSTVANLQRKGQALKMKVRYQSGTSVKTATIICDVNKAATASVQLVGKTFRGGEIKSAYFPRRARLG